MHSGKSSAGLIHLKKRKDVVSAESAAWEAEVAQGDEQPAAGSLTPASAVGAGPLGAAEAAGSSSAVRCLMLHSDVYVSW